MDKDTVLKLLDEKKLTDTLMKDKDFISEAKAILKEENPGITDENLEKILKSVEKALSGEVKIENDDDLDEVVGGAGSGLLKKVAGVAVKTTCTVGGTVLGGCSGTIAGSKITNTNGGATMGCYAGAAGGTLLGNRFGNFLCDKLGFND